MQDRVCSVIADYIINLFFILHIVYHNVDTMSDAQRTYNRIVMTCVIVPLVYSLGAVGHVILFFRRVLTGLVF